MFPSDNTAVCEALANPHLRAMMTSLVNSSDPANTARLMDAAMREPIFTDFVSAAQEATCIDSTEQ